MHVDSHKPGTIAWMDLMTDDQQGAMKFYGALFGWTFEVGGQETGGYAMAFKDGRMAAGIGQKSPQMQFPNAWSVYFGVENAEATLARVVSNGGQTMMPPMDIPQSGRMAMAVDNTGAVFGLWQPTGHKGAQLIDEPGAMTWYEVNTRDAEKARHFYSKVFDLEAVKMDAPGMTYWMLNRGEKTYAGILQMNEQWPKEIPPHWMGYFAVEDADAAAKKVAELGGKVMVPPFDSPYGRISVVQDPQGASFSVIKLSQTAQQM